MLVQSTSCSDLRFPCLVLAPDRCSEQKWTDTLCSVPRGPGVETRPASMFNLLSSRQQVDKPEQAEKLYIHCWVPGLRQTSPANFWSFVVVGDTASLRTPASSQRDSCLWLQRGALLFDLPWAVLSPRMAPVATRPVQNLEQGRDNVGLLGVGDC